MRAISDLKELAVADTPLIVFDCTLSNGLVEHWSTHRVTIGGTLYDSRVVQHSAFDIQTASDQGVDGSPRISVVLANADSHFSEIERSIGWKGASLMVGFLYFDLRNQVALTETMVVFQGICNPPDQIRETTFRLTAINRMNLQRLMLPQVRIQPRCPWRFPETAQQRTEAVDGGADGKYSMYYRCGYSPDIAGGTGSLNGGVPYTSCGYTRSDCEARGMFTRFGGFEFIPPTIAVRGYGKDWSASAVSVSQARYNDYVPMVYGTAWIQAMVVFARNDGNLTRMEVLLGIGQMQNVLTVLVNDVEIPQGVSGQNMTGTGWYNIQTLGTRDGCLDNNFVNANNQPAGDPYGSMAYLSVVVPNQISAGTSLPSVKVLAQGLIVPIYATDGSYVEEHFSNNPAWILLDILRRSGWGLMELDLQSFAAAAAYCDDEINATDLNGNPITLPRFQCNLVLSSRRSAGDVVRGVRNAARLYLTYGPGGVLQLQVENTLALEQPAKQLWSNSTEPLNGGWPSYEFGDGSNGLSGLLRQTSGEACVALTSRSIADTPNRLSTEFQDALNGYQQDSYEMVDAADIRLAGQEVSVTLQAVGLPHYDQAARILKFNLDKSIRGNTYIDFQTSVKGFGIRPGNLITVTYVKEGFNRQLFRVLKVSPATNYRTVTITAQIHDDEWYSDSNGQVSSASGGAPQGGLGAGMPRPLLGGLLDANGDMQLGVEESAVANTDGTIETDVSVSFIPPATTGSAGPGTALLNLSADIGQGGTLAGGQTLYYAISAVDSAGNEGGLSFLARAVITSAGSSVTLTGLSFPPGTMKYDVYRGTTAARLFRIASDQALAREFTDSGLAIQLIGPPDVNFDHANFYWRSELQPEVSANTCSASTVGNQTLQMAANAYRGMTVRITRGTGAGQERSIAANDLTSVTVASPWSVEPDATSMFVIAEAGWHFGALAKASPVQFAIPNRSGEVVQISGRSANVNDVECAAELCVVTRWTVGGSGGADEQAPPAPFFGLGLGTGGGVVELSGVSFTDLTNTRSISSGTLTVYYWDETQGAPATSLAAAMAAGDQVLTLNVAGPAQAGSTLQIEGEILRIAGVSGNGTEYSVTRGINGSTATAHAAETTVYHMGGQTTIVPFPQQFFGSPYSGSWRYPIYLPNVRVGSAELFLTNVKGNGATAGITLTHNDDSGLRTLSGGQYSIQVEGFLAVEQSVAPPLVVEATHSVGEIYAVLGTPADAPVQVQVNVNGASYCTLTFAASAIVSNSVAGRWLPALVAGAQITVSVLSVGVNCPGANLSVMIGL